MPATTPHPAAEATGEYLINTIDYTNESGNATWRRMEGS